MIITPTLGWCSRTYIFPTLQEPDVEIFGRTYHVSHVVATEYPGKDVEGLEVYGWCDENPTTVLLEPVPDKVRDDMVDAIHRAEAAR